ncbi:MAG: hypothetical protein OEU54_17510 [Gemmatimonadota bacterium]|nr:hypothetical protein [Gemmatimonadota bacterium]
MTDLRETSGADAPAPPAGEDEEGRIGIFPSWRAIYTTVLIYTAGLTAFLYLMTRILDHSVK